MRLSEAVDRYLDSVEDRCAPSTVKKYRDFLDEFANRLGPYFELEDVSTDHCEEFYRRYRNHAQKTKAGVHTALNQLFKYCVKRDKIAANPMDKIEYPKVPAPEDRGVKSISFKDVQTVMSLCETWTEKLCLGVLVYMGVRRAAANNLRWKDVDLEEGYIRFREKGGKYIRKPIPRALDGLLMQYKRELVTGRLRAMASERNYVPVFPKPSKPLFELLVAYRSLSEGGLETPLGNPGAKDASPRASLAPSESDYVIPSDRPTTSPIRNDRFIWRVVKRVCERAGVDAHCHAFRAAFAVHYLESYDGDTIGLQNLMGHSQIATTQGYWRRLNKERSMEKVRELDWGVSLTKGVAQKPKERLAAATNRESDDAGLADPSPFVSERFDSEGDTTRQGTVAAALVGSAEDGAPSQSEVAVEHDLVSHKDGANGHSDSMTYGLLRGKDSNLDSQKKLKASRDPRVKSSTGREKTR